MMTANGAIAFVAGEEAIMLYPNGIMVRCCKGDYGVNLAKEQADYALELAKRHSKNHGHVCDIEPLKDGKSVVSHAM